MKINWLHIFDWHIESVSEPKPVVRRQHVAGYDVVVHYTHHGAKTIFFDNRKANYSHVYSDAKQAAECTYRQYVDRMNTQKQK